MTTIINANTSAGLTQTADTSGIVKLQSNGVTTNALAWVNFNGTGTVAIRSSYNVSSITDNGTGDYTVNFATALADANYTVNTGGITSSSTGTGGGWWVGVKTAGAGTSASLKSTTQVQILSTNNGGSVTDGTEISVAIFGN